jgi:hypothetical protein
LKKTHQRFEKDENSIEAKKIIKNEKSIESFSFVVEVLTLCELPGYVAKHLRPGEVSSL